MRQDGHRNRLIMRGCSTHTCSTVLGYICVEHLAICVWATYMWVCMCTAHQLQRNSVSDLQHIKRVAVLFSYTTGSFSQSLQVHFLWNKSSGQRACSFPYTPSLWPPGQQLLPIVVFQSALKEREKRGERPSHRFHLGSLSIFMCFY